MAYIRYLSGYPKDLMRDVKLIKEAGVKCVEAVQRPIVETATGKTVLMCYELTFKGSVFQCRKAKKIIEALVHQD